MEPSTRDETQLPAPEPDGGDERLARCARAVCDGGGLAELCRHVVADRRYAASTRAVFQEMLEQVRGAIGPLR